MKIKVAHAIVGFSIGLICYAAYLYNIMIFGPRSSTYWLMPIPNQFGSASDYRKSVFYMLWQFNRLELIAVLIGLAFPFAFAGFAWFRAGKHPISWLRRWYIQLAFAVVGLLAVLIILNGITLILPMPPL